MKILIDLIHFPNINFFKPSITILENIGHKIILTTQRRGRLSEIVRKEFPNIKVYEFGKHTGTLYSMIGIFKIIEEGREREEGSISEGDGGV